MKKELEQLTHLQESDVIGRLEQVIVKPVNG
jgi:hypothetical protein